MRILLSFLFIFTFVFSTFAQDAEPMDSVLLGEVVISANNFETPLSRLAQQITVVNRKQIQWQNNGNMADLLQNTGQVFLQRSQGGGGSPIIRGFEANKVLIEIDGVRLNNAIFRGGHLQNVLRIDNGMLERAEIGFGPTSVIFGSDALGGVMNFTTRKPELNKNNVGAYIRYGTANQEKTAHVDFNAGGKKFAALLSATYSDFSDFKTGANRSSEYSEFGKRPWYVQRINGIDSVVSNSDPNVQIGTAYRQFDLIQKLLFKQSESIRHITNFQLSMTGDVPRYDRLTEGTATAPRQSEWYYGPEVRILGSYRFEHDVKSKFADKYSATLAWQNSEESRNSRNFRAANLKTQHESVNVASLDVDATKKIGAHNLSYGLEVYLNWVDSRANRTNVSTGALSAADTRYPDGGSKMNTYAAYIQDRIELGEKLSVNAGVRYTYTTLDATFNDRTFFPFPYNTATQAAGAITGNLGVVWLPTSSTKVSLMGSTGFRAPNVDDLSKVFESNNSTLVIPNPNLKPEYTYNGELSISQGIASMVTISATGFYTLLTDGLTTRPTTFNGSSTVTYNGNTANVISTQNQNKATVIGASAGLSAKIIDGLLFNGSFTYTRGRILASNGNPETPLDHIAPMFGQASLMYSKSKLQAELWSQFNLAKQTEDYLLGAEDNEIYSANKAFGYTPAWYTLNMRLGYQIIPKVNLQVACDNILDSHYRTFASGISGLGRNFRITLRGNF